MSIFRSIFSKREWSKFFSLLKESLQGKEQDYTKGSIPKAVFLLAIPMILELSLESVFAVVDIYFVSKLGQNAIATVGLTESVITIVYSVAIGLSTAATAVIARRVGEKNIAGASAAAVQSIFVALGATLFLSIFGVIYAHDILQFMGASEEVVRDGIDFTKIMLGSSGVVLFIFLINGIFRGAGNAAMAMKSLWLASAMNIILCPIFIMLFGLKGAAIATVCGRTSGVLYQCYHLFKGTGMIKLSKSDFTFDSAIIKSIIKIGTPATLQFIIASGSWMFLAKLVAETGGTAASAGYQLAIRNVVFFILPAWGISNTAATLVGQNLGAKEIKRAEESVAQIIKYNTIYMSFVTIVFVFFSSPIIEFFTSDEHIIRQGVLALQIIGSGFIFYGASMVLTQALNGSGDTKSSTIIYFVCFWMIQVPLGYYLSQTFLVTGALIAIPTAEILVSILSYIYFTTGRWKGSKV